MYLNNIKQISFAILFLTAFSMLSCVSTRSVLIDIPHPSPKELHESVQSLTLVSRVPDADAEDIHADTLQKIFYKSRFNLDTVIFDKQMADTTMKALGELLYESGRYDFVIPVQRFVSTGKSSSPSSRLSWDLVRDLTESMNTDALLSLDHLKTRIITKYTSEAYYDPHLNGFYSAAKAEMKIGYDAVFRVYYPAVRKIILEETLSDTLFWEDADVSARDLFERFTPVKRALTEAGITIALDLADKIAVRWYTVTRRYFTRGNEVIRQSNQLINSGRVEEALVMLNEAEQKTGSKSLRSKIQFNMAVCYEVLGDIDQAIYYALESYHSQFRTLTYEYLEILKSRKDKLKNQQ
jgi:tetratricopeptide (TPR) repeat protein